MSSFLIRMLRKALDKHTHVCVCTHTQTHAHTHTHTHMHACAHMHTHTCTHITCVNVHIHKHTHIYTHTTTTTQTTTTDNVCKPDLKQNTTPHHQHAIQFTITVNTAQYKKQPKLQHNLILVHVYGPPLAEEKMGHGHV